MKNIQRAYAKINLALDVVGKLDSGYHDLKTVMQTVNLYDEVIVTQRQDKQITLNISGADLPLDKNNIAYKAARAMMQAFKLKKGYTIDIHKNIPIAAGLAGGSADGSAVIRAIVKLENLKFKSKDLIDLAAQIGADLPFCLVGGTALCEGIGDIITPIKTKLDYTVVIVNSGKYLSTPAVFKALDFKEKNTHCGALNVKEALTQNDYIKLINHMSNDLTPPAISLAPQINDDLKELSGLNPDIVQMSGSGPTIFALFKNFNTADSAYKQLKLKYKKTFIIKPVKERIYDL